MVAFSARTATGSIAIFKGDGASRTQIADSVTNKLFKIAVGSPSINASGSVAFSSVRAEPGLPSSVFTGNGGPLVTVATTSTGGFSSFGNVAINESGTVAFRGLFSDGNEGVFTVRNRLIEISNTNKTPGLTEFGDPVINNSGTIAEGVSLFSQTGVISGNARGINFRTDRTANPPFTQLEHPSINNHGAVAFASFSGSPGTATAPGIYIETSGGASLVPVIRPGDLLFGSPVIRVNLGRFALSDRFEMVFFYALADGRRGIAVCSLN